MELPGLLGLLGITRITLELLNKSGITELPSTGVNWDTWGELGQQF